MFWGTTDSGQRLPEQSRSARSLLGVVWMLAALVGPTAPALAQVPGEGRPTGLDSTGRPERATAPPSHGPESALPPVNKRELVPRPPIPQWDVGILAGVCGLGKDAFWQGTEFCGGLVTEVLLWRRHRRGPGVGLMAFADTSGFFDARLGSGIWGVAPLSELLVVQARAGLALLTAAEGAQAGLDLDMEFGLKSSPANGHYAMTHTVALGVQHFPGTLSRATTAVSIRLRLDAFWLLLPVAALR